LNWPEEFLRALPVGGKTRQTAKGRASPGRLWIGSKIFELNPDVPVTRQTPPTFLLQAENDDVDSVNNSLGYCVAPKNAGVPAEMYLFAEGKRAFGLRPTRIPITRWPGEVETWLGTIGMISKQVRRNEDQGDHRRTELFHRHQYSTV
jgi:hypothetical protein